MFPGFRAHGVDMSCCPSMESSPYQEHITKLENVQKFALMMRHENWDAGYRNSRSSYNANTWEQESHLKLWTLYKITYDFPLKVLCLSQVEFLTIHPSYSNTNFPSTLNTFSCHLYLVPTQYGSVFPTLLSLHAPNITTFRWHAGTFMLSMQLRYTLEYCMAT